MVTRPEGLFMSIKTEKNFLNFPLIMLAKTHTDPKSGMNAILDYAFWKFAQSIRHDYKDAFIQAVYQSQRHPDRIFPRDVQFIMNRNDVEEFVEYAMGEGWLGDQNFTNNVGVMFDESEITLDDTEQEALVLWLGMREAASLLGWVIKDFDEVRKKVAQSQKEIDKYAQEHGVLVWATCPADYFKDTYRKNSDPEAMRIFRCVVAVRSLVGAKQFTGTTKDMLRARMIGGKTPAVAEVMAAQSEPLSVELNKLGSRKRFDRILTEGAVRKFYGKFGTGRRVYLSLTAKDPETLATMVNKKLNRHASYKASEQKARDKIRGTARGQQEGIDRDTKGDTFNNTLNNTLNKTLFNTNEKTPFKNGDGFKTELQK